MKYLHLLAALLIPHATALAAPPGFTLAPNSRITNGALLIPEGNCIVPTPPGDGWRWYVGPSPPHVSSYACVNESTTQRLVVTTTDFPVTAISQEALNRSIDGIREAASPAGYDLRRLTHAPADLSVPGAHRFSFELAAPNNPSVFIFGYLIPTGYSCMLSIAASEQLEPKSISQVALGVRIAHPLTTTDLFPAITAMSSPLNYLVLAAIAFGIATAYSRFRRRPVNAWTAVFVSVMALGFLNMAYLERVPMLAGLG